MRSDVEVGAKLALTCVSAAMAETITYPIDMVKTRLQRSGEGGVSSPSTQSGRRGAIR